MPLKDYTTEVPAKKSAEQILSNLVNHHATGVGMTYGPDQVPTSLVFGISTPQGELSYKLPANIEKVYQLLLKMRRSSWDEDVQKKVHAQAARVAWRILKDWVDAQLAIIETEQVTITEVFLPYMIIANTGNKTVYELMTDKGYKLISPGQ
jgi:hypothetical protein